MALYACLTLAYSRPVVLFLRVGPQTVQCDMVRVSTYNNEGFGVLCLQSCCVYFLIGSCSHGRSDGCSEQRVCQSCSVASSSRPLSLSGLMVRIASGDLLSSLSTSLPSRGLCSLAGMLCHMPVCAFVFSASGFDLE